MILIVNSNATGALVACLEGCPGICLSRVNKGIKTFWPMCETTVYGSQTAISVWDVVGSINGKHSIQWSLCFWRDVLHLFVSWFV